MSDLRSKEPRLFVSGDRGERGGELEEVVAVTVADTEKTFIGYLGSSLSIF